MPADEENKSKGWLSNIDLPDWMKSRTIKALDQLSGAALNVGEAYFDGIAESLRAKTRRSIRFDDAINELAIEKASAVGGFEERALAAHQLRVSRFQLNRDKIAVKALEYIAESTENPELQGEVVDVNWLDIFGDYAEKISTPEMQQIWAKILAGELRTPGKFSRSTLLLLSNLSKSDAELISDYNAQRYAGGLLAKICDTDGFFNLDFIRLEEIGMLVDTRKQVSWNEGMVEGLCIINNSRELAKITLSESGEKKLKSKRKAESVTYPHIPFTLQGRELFSILKEPTIEQTVDTISNLFPGFAKQIDVYTINRVDENGINYDEDTKRNIKCS